MLNDQVLLLSKKHGQLKQATTKMVQEVMGFLEDTPDLETKLSVIETLRTVTEGKVVYLFLEPYRRMLTAGRFSSKSSELASRATYRRSKNRRAT